MARLFWQPDLEQRCVEASRSPAKRLLIALKNRFQEPRDSVVLLVQADGTTRSLWGGISDKEVGRYDRSEESCPTQINVGSPQAEYRYPLVGSGVRIIRIRCNQEVPDYCTERSAKSREDHVKHASASGVFRYRKVFWSIHAKPHDPQYNRSLDTSRLDRPAQRFAEKDMIELYPLQLQPGDDAAEWIFYANALRHIPIQYQQSTNLPLPLHLAKALEEYLFRM